MEQFNIFYELFIELGLSNDLANLSSCCALALLLAFACFLWVLSLCSLGYLIGCCLADKKYYLYFNKTHYFYSIGKSRFKLRRIKRKHLFVFEYIVQFSNKEDMLTFINQLSLLPIDKKVILGDLWIS